MAQQLSGVDGEDTFKRRQDTWVASQLTGDPGRLKFVAVYPCRPATMLSGMSQERRMQAEWQLGPVPVCLFAQPVHMGAFGEPS